MAAGTAISGAGQNRVGGVITVTVPRSAIIFIADMDSVTAMTAIGMAPAGVPIAAGIAAGMTRTAAAGMTRTTAAGTGMTMAIADIAIMIAAVTAMGIIDRTARLV